MAESVIKAEGLGKKYIISHQGTKGYKTFREQMLQHAHNFYSRTKKLFSGQEVIEGDEIEEFWALKDLNFEIKQGDRVGIIGKNGAGKSTLLKVLSRITEPTTGKVFIKGRVASLLEVGTGFHPELTGRENVFLNGAIMGMSRAEIKRKFDEIVDFAGVERYINTPVKRYSSGMYVRLAFAVAAFLEPEILIVDEVLAVGDAEFQKKCLGRMKDVSVNEGRTILFVSHNMAAVKSLCTHGIVMQYGNVVFDGGINEAVNFYQKGHNTNSSFEHTGELAAAPGNEHIRVLKFDVSPLSGDVISVSSGLQLNISFYNSTPGINLDVTFEIKNTEEVVILHQGTILSKDHDSRTGVYTVSGKLPANLLNAGNYLINLVFGQDQRYALFTIRDLVQFEIMNESLGSNSSILPGVIRPAIQYSHSFKPIDENR